MRAKNLVEQLCRAAAVGCMLYAMTLVGQTARATESASTITSTDLVSSQTICVADQDR